MQSLTGVIGVMGLCLVFAGEAVRAEDRGFSDPAALPAPPAGALGYPSRDAVLDALPGFRSPPPGYGQVPFWWWTGDPLDKERLLWQIEELHRKGVAGMQVNYAHEDTPGWPTYAAEPEPFSGEWWTMWRYVAEECRKRDMGIGLSGYTLDWPGKSTNLLGRLVYSDPELHGVELAVGIRSDIRGGKLTLGLPANWVAVRACRVVNKVVQRGGIDLSSHVNGGRLEWMADGGPWRLFVFVAQKKPVTLNPMHPESGRRMIEKFFQPFEDAAGGTSKGLNYFFQDELKFGVSGRLWTSDLPEQFRKRKGYDLLEVLPALFEDIGPVTPKARLDYADVKMQLIEERYFRPIFDWHWKRGLIYGCDPGSRGKSPDEFGDYFRSVRWYTAPGHDTPGGQADLIKGKVSTSIAHLYQRPRVWLEGYHSLGWGATPSTLMKATRENYLYGCTLLNLHGLYYSTHGSFWEWAPPCYHFRMPYWEHMDVFFKYFERLSYLLSQGVHVCDVAIVYPVAPFDAQLGGKEATAIAFAAGTRLMNAGTDFDFIDFESLARAQVKDGRLHVSGEAYRVLVLPAMKAVRWSSIQKAMEFKRAGGIVIAIGALPEASDHAGREDADLDAAVKELFGAAAMKVEDLTGAISQSVPPDVQATPAVMSLHRRIGPRDVYMVMRAARGSECTFRAQGKVELWDPWTGQARPLHITARTAGGTKVRIPLDADDAQVIVFSPGETAAQVEATDLDEVTDVRMRNGKPIITGRSASAGRKTATVRVNGQVVQLAGEAPNQPALLPVEGDWEFELKPTMDNRFGDFRLPASPAMIAAEARRFRYAQEKPDSSGWEAAAFDDSKWPVLTYGFGQQFWVLGPMPEDADAAALDQRLSAMKKIDPAEAVEAGGKRYAWRPYAFSWRWGVEGDPGHQGYHGLKMNVSYDFIRLGTKKAGLNETLYVKDPAGSRYYLWTSAAVEANATAKVVAGGLKPAAVYVDGVKLDATEVKLKAGSNPLLLRYDAPGRGHFVLERVGLPPREPRTPLSMIWHDRPGVVPFDPHPEHAQPAGWYRFTAPPGLRSMTITARGTVRAWVEGRSASVDKLPGGQFVVRPERPVPSMAKVAIRIEQQRGSSDGAALPEPILLDCGPGRMALGDWSQGSALECYSGGAWYRRTVALAPEQLRGQVLLHLGEVAATAEVRINGKRAGTRVAAPWTVDITPHVQAGDNRIEILVFNTLSNHYLTVPTRYRGHAKSGLIGPVTIEMRLPVTLAGD